MIDRVVLHIGLDKTGTTAIQQGCHNARDALRAERVIYPTSRQYGFHHLDFARQFGFSWTDVSDLPDVIERAADYREQLDPEARCLVLSSEHFVYSIGNAAIRDLKLWLNHFLPEARVDVVLFVRNQVDWFISVYGESIKWGIKSDIDSFYETAKGRLDFLALAQKWAAAFGTEGIRIASYEACNGEVTRPFFDLLRVSRATWDIAHRKRPKFSNQTIAPAVLEAVRELDFKSSRDEIYNFLAGHVALDAFYQEFLGKPERLWKLPRKLLEDLPVLEAKNGQLAATYSSESFKIPDLQQRAHNYESGVSAISAAQMDDIKARLIADREKISFS
ncbi:hypothetical protein [Siccirubricoccus sp. G192]|uniref:hypothetical protein n=1 Tax=Siccirubricoccus sp. G192 TaxID=2849651 RepID=UPI001C2C3F3C|nr:hypothetical protein [Siccirubricoccus sp. G192]MBV1796724.1 hypothetical protein [Siccirubricoccus sp. G192]